jgi:hypothetical protein
LKFCADIPKTPLISTNSQEQGRNSTVRYSGKVSGNLGSHRLWAFGCISEQTWRSTPSEKGVAHCTESLAWLEHYIETIAGRRPTSGDLALLVEAANEALGRKHVDILPESIRAKLTRFQTQESALAQPIKDLSYYFLDSHQLINFVSRPIFILRTQDMRQEETIMNANGQKENGSEPQPLANESRSEFDLTTASDSHNPNGPPTPAGKARSRHNACKHGIFAKVALLKSESRSQFDSLLSGLQNDLQPEGTLEQLLVEKLATLLWRYRRLMIAQLAVSYFGTKHISGATSTGPYSTRTTAADAVGPIGGAAGQA